MEKPRLINVGLLYYFLQIYKNYFKKQNIFKR